MLSEKSLRIVGCVQDEHDYWMPDNDGDFEYITDEHIIGVLVTWSISKDLLIGREFNQETSDYIIYGPDRGAAKVIAKNKTLLTTLDEAVQAVNERGD